MIPEHEDEEERRSFRFLTGEEEEHSDFMYRNGAVRPKITPKEANWGILEHEEEAVIWTVPKGVSVCVCVCVCVCAFAVCY